MTQRVDPPSIKLPPPLTPEEIKEMKVNLERARRFREHLLAMRGGRLFRSAGEEIAELRDERDAELP